MLTQKSLFPLVNFLFFLGTCNASAIEKGKDPSITMDEIVVTATKTDEARKDIPNSVIIIDSMDIEESAATSLGELLANELGIDWRTYGDYGGAAETIKIRGMDATATQVLINGVIINSPSLGTASVGGIPLNNIDRIEVVKGAGSLLYGSNPQEGRARAAVQRPRPAPMSARKRSKR